MMMVMLKAEEEEVQEVEGWLNKDEIMAVYANNLKVKVLEQMVKFEKEMDAKKQDESENQMEKKVMVVKMDLIWNFYLKEDHRMILLFHF